MIREPNAWAALSVVLLLRSIVPAESARVLAVETVGGRSHWNFMSGLLRALTEAGHDVTAFTPFPEGDRENYTEVDTSETFQIRVSMGLTKTMEIMGNAMSVINMVSGFSRYHCDVIFDNPRFVEILRNDRGRTRFDVIVVEPLMFDCMSQMANALKLPIIYSIPSPMISFMERDITGHVSNPACVSNLIAHHAVPQTFVQRLTNTVALTYMTLKRYFNNWLLMVTDPRPYGSSPKVFPSVIFQNSYHETEKSRHVPPNLIDVGGIHLKPVRTIPKDILDFIEESPHGVILFTFGSTIKLSSLPKHIEIAFKEALANVPQRFLWKYEKEMTDLPKNVMTRKWFPQRDILMHPNVKLFISHGGMSGVYEALDAGVPVLGFPLFYDQPRNIANLVNAGMAISMDVLSVSKDSLLHAISELTNNEKYMRNAKIASDRFKDRPMTPQQSVVYWTEYVIRHKGAPHLQYHGQNLTWYQHFILDVAATVLLLIFLFMYIAYIVFKFILRYKWKRLFLRSPNNKVKMN